MIIIMIIIIIMMMIIIIMLSPCPCYRSLAGCWGTPGAQAGPYKAE